MTRGTINKPSLHSSFSYMNNFLMKKVSNDPQAPNIRDDRQIEAVFLD